MENNNKCFEEMNKEELLSVLNKYKELYHRVRSQSSCRNDEFLNLYQLHKKILTLDIADLLERFDFSDNEKRFIREITRIVDFLRVRIYLIAASRDMSI
jgi:hypothetical protein